MGENERKESNFTTSPIFGLYKQEARCRCHFTTLPIFGLHKQEAKCQSQRGFTDFTTYYRALVGKVFRFTRNDDHDDGSIQNNHNGSDDYGSDVDNESDNDSHSLSDNEGDRSKY